MENYNKKSYQLIYFLIIGLFLASCSSTSGLLKPYQKGNIDIADNFSIEGKFKLSMPDSKETGYFFLKKTKDLVQINIGKNCPLVNTELGKLAKSFPDLKANVLGVIRGDKFVILKKKDKILIDDKAFVVVIYKILYLI